MKVRKEADEVRSKDEEALTKSKRAFVRNLIAESGFADHDTSKIANVSLEFVKQVPTSFEGKN